MVWLVCINRRLFVTSSFATVNVNALVASLPVIRILVVRGTKVYGDTIARADELELIVRAGAGTENIDLDAASARGVYVTNCPDRNSAAVAELTLGLLLAIDRRIPEQSTTLMQGKWDKTDYSKADGLKGKTFEVVGTGAIGREVIKRAKAFDMLVVAWSRSLTDVKAAELGVVRAATLDELIAKCDIVSLHVALTPETTGLLSREHIGKLKHRAIILNTSRGPVIDYVALVEALRDGRVRAGLDVYESEPADEAGTFSSVLVGVPNWVGTHHIGASTTQAQVATADETIRIIGEYVRTGNVENCVNFAKETPAIYELIVRHYDKLGVLTGILTELRESKISVHEVHNIIFKGAKAAVAHIQLDTYPPQLTLDRILARKDEIISLKIVRLQPIS